MRYVHGSDDALGPRTRLQFACNTPNRSEPQRPTYKETLAMRAGLATAKASRPSTNSNNNHNNEDGRRMEGDSGTAEQTTRTCTFAYGQEGGSDPTFIPPACTGISTWGKSLLLLV